MAASRRFIVFFGAVQLVLFLLFLNVDYDSNPIDGTPEERASGANSVRQFYGIYTDVTFMMFFGFGYLMTFLKKYGFSAVGFTFLITCLCVEVGIIAVNIMEHVHEDKMDEKWRVNLVMLLEGDFAAACVLICFGVLLGKATIEQMLFIAIVQICIYACNLYFVVKKLEIIDVGGSIIVHMFGAYFGLAASTMLSPRRRPDIGYENNGSSYQSDMFAMIGTLFLFVCWPSFNGAVAGEDSQWMAIINTVLSLASCCMSTYLFCAAFKENKFEMVDVQNATLAGGVAMGTIANLDIGPAMAILVGFTAGLISVAGYTWVSPWMEDRWPSLQDTCGVHNLHGMPSVFAAVISIFATVAAKRSDYPNGRYDEMFPRGDDQPLYQLAAIFVTLAVAIPGGLLTGFLANYMFPAGKEKFFHDDVHWHVPVDLDGLEGAEEEGAMLVEQEMKPIAHPQQHIEQRPVATQQPQYTQQAQPQPQQQQYYQSQQGGYYQQPQHAQAQQYGSSYQQPQQAQAQQYGSYHQQQQPQAQYAQQQAQQPQQPKFHGKRL